MKIILSVPYGKEVSDVVNMLREEYGTSTNIGDPKVRSETMFGIKLVADALKEIGEIPHDGIVITYKNNRVIVENRARHYFFRLSCGTPQQ